MSRALKNDPGVITFTLDTINDIATVNYDPVKTSVKQITIALSAAGYPPAPDSIVEQP